MRWVVIKMHAGKIFVLVIFVGLFFNAFYRTKKAKRIAKKYFKEKQIEIIKIEYRFWGPLLLLRSNLQVCFYTKLRKKDGETTEAYIKVGHWLAGLLEPIVHVYQIDDEGKIIDRTKRKSILDVIFPERRN